MTKASDIRAGGGQWELSVGGPFAKQLKAAEEKIRSVSAGFAKAGAGLVGIGAGIGAPLLAAANNFAAVGDELNKMSGRTGVSVQSLSELKHALGQSGSNLTQFESSVRRMQANLLDFARGTGEAKDAFGELGLSVSDLEGLSPEDQFLKIADALSKITDPSKQAALAMRIFGRSGTSLLPMIQQGTEGIQALRKEARDLGIDMSDETAADAAALTDAMAKMSKAFKQISINIGAAVAPAITKAADKLAVFGANINKAVKANAPFIRTIGKIAVGMVAVGGALLGVSAALKGVAVLQPIVGAGWAIASGPVGLVVGAMAAATAGALAFTDAGRGVASFLGSTFMQTFKGVSDALMSGNLELAGKVALAGLKLVWVKGTNAIVEAWGGFQQTILQIGDVIAIGLIGAFEQAFKFVTTNLKTMAATIKRIPLLPRHVADGLDALAGITTNISSAAASARSSIESKDRVAETAKRMDAIAKSTARAENEFKALTAAAAKAKKEFDDGFKDLFKKQPSPADPLGAFGRSAQSAFNSLKMVAQRLGLSAMSAAKGLFTATGDPGPTEQQMSHGVQSRGTFSATAASFLGGANSAATRIEANTRISAEALQEIVRKQAIALGVGLPVT